MWKASSMIRKYVESVTSEMISIMMTEAKVAEERNEILFYDVMCLIENDVN